jgi:MoaA/NifB/PqqE/SkfB family radical SAM enzyme
MAYFIDNLKAPLLVSWQMTRDCNLACLHCCTESAPGKTLPDELDAEGAMKVAEEIISCQVPYVMLCGGEPLILPHFFAVAESLGSAGVHLKIETNGHVMGTAEVERLARLPIRSVQISLDADSQEVYVRQRPGGQLEKAHNACRVVRDAGLPLEITFAPTRINIHEAESVIERALSFGAFRFNTGKLMRIGTAARLWHKLEPLAPQYGRFQAMLDAKARQLDGVMELCYTPFSIEESLRDFLRQPPATLLVLPNGRIKVAAALSYICADLRRQTIAEAWDAYRRAWHDELVVAALRRASLDDTEHSAANSWQPIPEMHI